MRSKKGFDIVFVDELHLFNRQERHVLRFLTRDVNVRRVAVAYDPRQSPRNTFFPSVRINGRDTIWSEPRLAVGSKDFNFADIFRYTPQILSLLRNLDQHFPGADLAAEWGLVFGVSKVAAGEKPNAREHKSARLQAKFVSERAINLSSRSKGRKRVAVLCLDPSQFDEYRQAGLFTVKFVIVSARDETALIQKYNERPILSMPEYVAGLQFDTVLLVDVNAFLIVRLGGGLNGLHKFISTTYLGASRAMRHLEIHANKDQGGLPALIQQAVHNGLINPQS